MKRILFILWQISFLFQAYSQYAPMSPQVSSAEGLFTPALYSGSANVNIPVYNYTARDITVPVSLSYTSGNGIRVNEESSWVGLGWHLNSGGFIAQQVRGYDDFSTTGYIGSTKKFPCLEGQVSLPYTGPDCAGTTTTATLSLQDVKDYDLEPDMFILTMPGYNAKFFYDKQLNVFSSSVTTLNIIRNGTSGFTVETQDGLSYNFSVVENSYDMGATDPRYQAQGKTWHLSTITSLITGEIVTFIYSINAVNRLKQKSYSKTIYQNAPTSTVSFYRAQTGGWGVLEECFECSPETGNTLLSICPTDFCTSTSGYFNASQTRIFERDIVYLETITSSSGFYKMYFNKGTRGDIGNTSAKKLDEIVVSAFDEKGQEANILRQTFAYSLFESNSSNNPGPGSYYGSSYYPYPYPGYEGKRLKLVSLQQKSGDGLQLLPAHLFSYVESTQSKVLDLPYKTSFDIDHWGYYNWINYNQHNTDLVAVNMTGIKRSSTDDIASSGLLKKIRYPQGGYLEFDYIGIGAGVCLQKVSNYETSNNKIVKKYSYTENPSFNFTPTYPEIVPYAQLWSDVTCNLGTNVNGNIVLDGGKVINGQSHVSCYFNVYTSTNALSFSDMSSVSPKNFTMVTEWNGENGETGKTEYYFPAISYDYTPTIPINKNPLEGLLSKKIVYKNTSGNYINISFQEYIYDFETNNKTTSNGIKSFISYTTTTTYNASSISSATGYRMKFIRLNGQIVNETLFDQNDVSKSQTSTSVQKNDAFGLLKESYTNNNPVSGVGNYSRIYRYYEKATGGTTLVKYKPVETIAFTYTGNINSNPAKKAYASNYVQYTSLGLPQFTWVSNAAVTSSAGLFPSDVSYRKTGSYIFETVNKNPQQQDALLEENFASGYNKKFISSTTLWGYKNSLPVAVIANADISQVAYSGFEANILPATNGWDPGMASNVLIDQTNIADKENVFSGRFSVKVGPATSVNPDVYSPTVNINPVTQSGRYKMSCWVKIPGNIAQNKAYIKMYTYQTGAGYAIFPNSTCYAVSYLDHTKHDWQYIEMVLDVSAIKLLPNGSANISIRCFAGNQDLNHFMYIDDIRIYPLDAQMSTYTYRPGYGKSSESGPDSKPVHYEFDAFGRLEFVRDFRRNILKRNQYFNY